MEYDTIATKSASVLAAFTVGGFIVPQLTGLDSRVSWFITRKLDFGER